MLIELRSHRKGKLVDGMKSLVYHNNQIEENIHGCLGLGNHIYTCF